jgi:hypothetical protein
MMKILNKIPQRERTLEKVNIFKEKVVVGESLCLAILKGSGNTHTTIQQVSKFFVEVLLGIDRESSDAGNLEILIKKAMSYERPEYAIEKEGEKELERKFEGFLKDYNVPESKELAGLLIILVQDHNRMKNSEPKSSEQSTSALNVGDVETISGTFMPGDRTVSKLDELHVVSEIIARNDLHERFSVKELVLHKDKVAGIIRIGGQANYNNLTEGAKNWYNRTYKVTKICLVEHCHNSVDHFLSLHPNMSQSRLKIECKEQYQK